MRIESMILWIRLKYWFSGIGSFVFSNQYKICIPVVHNMNIFYKVDFSSLRNVGRQIPAPWITHKKLPKLLGATPSGKSHQIWYIFIIKCQNNCPETWVTDLAILTQLILNETKKIGLFYLYCFCKTLLSNQVRRT